MGGGMEEAFVTFFSSSRLQAVKSATIRLTTNINIHG